MHCVKVPAKTMYLRERSLRTRLAGMIGNILGHYDNALFGLLVPFISPLFFAAHDPLTALILTYAILPVGIIARPLGSLFFGWLGNRYGKMVAFSGSLLGIALATVCIGLLPTYQQIGLLAPVLLAIGRGLQHFCQAGETIGGAIVVLEHTEETKKSLMSSLYDVSSMVGIFFASAMVTLLSSFGYIEQGWRYLFLLGSVTAVFGLFLRKRTPELPNSAPKQPKLRLINMLTTYKRELLAIIVVSGLCYTTYAFAFTLMNGFIPLITNLSKTEVMQANTVLLLIDVLLLPCFGYLASKVGKEKIMLIAACCLAASAIVLFSLFHDATLLMVTSIRFIVMLFGVAFAASYHAWALERVPSEARYAVLSFGASLGSQLIGAPSTACSLWLYQQTSWIIAPAIYLTVIATLAAYTIYRTSFSQARERGVPIGLT